MNIVAKLLQKWCGRKPRQIRKRSTHLCLEVLERRDLLSGDPVSTSISLSSTLDTSGTGLTFHASVTPTLNGCLTITGSVVFSDSAMTQTVGIDSSGNATFDWTTVPSGSHSVTATYSGDGNFDGSVSLVDTVGSATINIRPYTGVYDGTAHGLSGTAAGVNGDDLSSLLDLGAMQTDAGNYTIDWTFAGDNNDITASGSSTISIAKANADVTVTPYTSDDTIYDGAAYTATGTATGVGGVDLSSQLDLSDTTHTDAGTYAGDTWSFIDTTGNYNSVASTPITDTIAEANADIAVTPYSGVFDGSAHGLSGTATGVNGEDLSSLLDLGATQTGAGDTSVAWTFAGNTDYASAGGTSTIDIGQATASIVVNGYSGVYDGSAHGLSGTATGVNDEDLSSLLDLGATQTDAGDTSVAWTFAGNTDYVSASGTSTIDIGQANATIAVIPYSGVYDGSAHGLSGTATGVNGEDLSNLLDLGATQTDAGDNTVAWTFAGNGDYASVSGTSTIDIGQATASIVVNGYSGVYDGSAHGLSGTATGVIGEDLSSLLGLGATQTDAGDTSVAWTFGGNADYASASGASTINIGQANATVAVIPYSGVYDGSPHGLSGTATGVNGEDLSSLLDLGATQTDAGSYPTAWTFAGNTDYTSTNGSSSISIVKAATATSLSVDNTPAAYGQAVTFTAVVTPFYPGGGVPNGTVSFYEEGTLLDMEPLDGTGTALFTTSALNLGTHNISAEYSGDANDAASTSPNVQVVIQANTTTIVSASSNPSVVRQPVTFTATVTGNVAGSTPTGTVTFSYGATTMGPYTLNAAGQATVSFSPVVVGNFNVTAVYSGDSTFAGSTSPVLTETINQATTSTELTSNNNPSITGDTVTFTARVTGNTLGPPPTGLVIFYDGAAPLGVGILNGGVTTFATSSLDVGTHSITSAYGGDSTFVASTSPVLNQIVNAGPPGLHWVGYVNSDMSLAANYLEQRAPVPGDTIIFDTPPGGLLVVNADASSALVPWLSMIRINNGYTGTITIDEDMTINNLLLGSAAGATATVTIDSGFVLTVNQATLNGGSLNGTGGTLSLVGGTATVLAPSTEAVFQFNIANNAQFTILTDLSMDGTEVTNQGALNWAGGNLYPDSATVITNESQFTISAAGSTLNRGAIVTNNGQMVVALSSPAATVTIQSDLVNDSSLNVVCGTLDLGGVTQGVAVTSSAAITIDVGSTLVISGGVTLTATAGASFSGGGTLTVLGGLVNTNGGATLQIGTIVNVVGANLTGPGNFQITGSNTAITSSLGIGPSLTLTNTVLLLAGFTTWVSGDIELDNSQIQNQGTFVIQGGDSMTSAGGGPIVGFFNLGGGNVGKAAGDVTTFQVPVVSNGNISLLSLTKLAFQLGFTQTGGVVSLGGGTLDLTPAGGGGAAQGYQLNGGRLVGPGSITGGDLNNTGGTVEVSRMLTLTGNYTQGAQGTFQVDAIDANPLNWGFFNIIGTATLAGNLTLNLSTGYVPVGGIRSPRYIILAATGGVSGTLPRPPGWSDSGPNSSPITVRKRYYPGS